MAKKKQPGGNPAKKVWRPLEPGPPSEAIIARCNATNTAVPIRVWRNNQYEVYERRQSDERMTWLSIKRIDQKPIHDWRHLQQIKNEVCGPEREAMELYPAESRLADSSNQYHLWVMPEGIALPFGFPDGDRFVMTPEQSAEHGGVQRPWEDGLTTGQAA